MADEAKIGIIGGSGFYDLIGQENVKEYAIRTPYGAPSDPVRIGSIAGEKVAFIARHGKGHRYTPSEVPYAANMWALKSLGVRFVLAVSACGSLREDYAPGSVCIPDQLIDLTRGTRQRTFFGEGLVSHVGVADPFTPELSAIFVEAAQAAGATVHSGGTYVTIEGPRFSTRAESETYRKLGYSIIGMTTCPEAFLAREAEMAYSIFAHITDYDVWHPAESAVTAAAVMETFHHNLNTAKRAIVEAIPRVAAVQDAEWSCHHALEGSIMTDLGTLPSTTMEKLRPIAGKYFEKPTP